MRHSENYQFKRICLKIQYEILSIGLSQSMIDISRQHANLEPITCNEENYEGVIHYYKFSRYFVDNMYNLKGIMM